MPETIDPKSVTVVTTVKVTRSKFQLFLIRQAKSIVATAMPVLIGANLLDPDNFQLHSWKGFLHELTLLGMNVGSIELTHYVLPLLASGFILVQKWSTSSTNGE